MLLQQTYFAKQIMLEIMHDQYGSIRLQLTTMFCAGTVTALGLLRDMGTAVSGSDPPAAAAGIHGPFQEELTQV